MKRYDRGIDNNENGVLFKETDIQPTSPTPVCLLLMVAVAFESLLGREVR